MIQRKGRNTSSTSSSRPRGENPSRRERNTLENKRNRSPRGTSGIENIKTGNRKSVYISPEKRAEMAREAERARTARADNRHDNPEKRREDRVRSAAVLSKERLSHSTPKSPRPSTRATSALSSRRGKDEGGMRLNKFIAHAGVCSRRDADMYIRSGNVMVNGAVVTEMGYKVQATDRVCFDGVELKAEKKVYVLLNKPKNYITTTDDPEKRRTVMDLIKNATRERIYPVGRLDRSTMGLLLFTNDGEMAKGIMHPSSNIKKTYQVTLDRNLTAQDMGNIRAGIELEDGIIQVDNISYLPDARHNELGVELHSGRNRIVRRIFEHLGYQVVKLDRVQLGPLTKKNLSRGMWRFLTQSEINMLKMLSNGKATAEYDDSSFGLE